MKPPHKADVRRRDKIMKRKYYIILVTLIFGLMGCGTLQLNPVTSETRAVRTLQDPAKTITVSEGMVWYDGRAATRGLRFPPGTYVIEAEDDDYWYFRSATALEFRVFKGDSVADSRDIPGGIMIGKTSIQMVPAGAYIDGEGSVKIMVWKLGKEFLRLEGRNWKKSF